jgi:pyridoxamine 5'-phosphate oxidase
MAMFGEGRVEYDRGSLSEADVSSDPFEQLARWLQDAVDAGVTEPTGMALSTVDEDGRVTSRNVLLRGIVDGRLRFFTNYHSDKARALAVHPRCALLFSWFDLQRQVRVEGTAEVLDEAASDEYFAHRPRESRIGAWASPQSSVLAGREELDRRVAEVEARFAATDEIPRPPFWGGYGVVPEVFEFWQGRPSRLHDRLRYRRGADDWVLERLAP